MKVKKFETSLDRSIYSFPVLAFPGLYSNIYVIKDREKMVLVDCGSGMESSNQDLLAGLAALEETYGGSFKLAGMNAIFITHGHIDHFGGLPFIRRFTDAPVAVHSLDRRVLTHYEERVLVASRLLETFLQRAGVPDEKQIELIEMYMFAKGVYRSTPVEIILKEGYLEDFGIEVIHVPGHCPGQVCLRIDDILLTADHVLSYTTPHQSPESITNHMGLDHYLQSLDKIARVEGIRLGLGGHEEPIPALVERIEEIKGVHEDRLSRILDICSEPRTTSEVSYELFGQVSSYHALLALEEAGAHIEYLYQYGELVATNLEQIENDPSPTIQYQRC